MLRKAWITTIIMAVVGCWGGHLNRSLFAAEADKSSPTTDPIEFNRDIRPLLSERCFRCHGPDSNAREAELRLDHREEALKTAIVPGKPDTSELIARITSDDSDVRMPPAGAAKPLTDSEVALIVKWIEQGAPYQDHWSFLPLVRPQIPAIGNRTGISNDIDVFIRHRLQRTELTANPPADRRTLIRRLSFDLLGLPPTPEEVEQFVGDRRRDAYEHLVNRLLASPHFGERMAVHWLDLVRYADTVGYHGDQPISVWPYRDYVIQAFNRNLPFDEFTREQLAGDLLPNRSTEQLIASGYNRLNMMTAEGGAQPSEYLAKYAADRVRTTSTVWLGITLGCAECHDHKFDPFSTRDFYSFAAFFADIEEKGFYGGAHVTGDWGPKITVPSAAQQAELNGFAARISAAQKRLKEQSAELDDEQSVWEKKSRGVHVDWVPLTPKSAKSTGDINLQILDDGSVLSTGGTVRQAEYTLELEAPFDRVTAIRIEALADDRLPKGGPGRAENGNFVLQQVTLKSQNKAIPLDASYASFSQSKFGVASAIDNDPKTGWAVLPQIGESQIAVFRAAQSIPRVGDKSVPLTLHLVQKHGTTHLLGRFRISVTGIDDPVRMTRLADDRIQTILGTSPNERNAEQKEALSKLFRDLSPLLNKTRAQIASLQQQRDTLQKRLPTTLVTTAVKPRTMRILPRGNWMDNSGEIVQSAAPKYLAELSSFGDAKSRVELANWLTSRDNPLVARAFVNRLWRVYFGTGLSKTLDDLGAQGEWPSHPELLDWLAVEFIESGWDVKHIVEQIVTSATYRQSSDTTELHRQRDPYNRLLARQSRFRLDAEYIRDNALAISGLLETTLGGPSCKPYQPSGYYAQLNFPKRVYKADDGPSQYRRGLYMHWQRTFLHPMLASFDAPSREECTAERPRSNTPLAALVMLNDPTFVEAARVFAERILSESSDSTNRRLEFAFREALSRDPQPAERELLMGLLERQQEHFERKPEAANELLETGQRPVDSMHQSAELAAWTTVARAILNLHETITRY